MSATADASQPTSQRATGSSLILIWALELALARITSDAVPLAEVAVSAIVLVLLPLCGLAGLARAPLAPATLAAVAGLLGSLPLFLVASGIVIPVALRFSGTALAGVLLGLLSTILVAGIQRTRRSGGPVPGPGLILGVLMASSATAWVVMPTGFPPYQIALPFLAVSIVGARIAMREDRIPILTAMGVALALWPAVLPPFPWPAHVTQADGPDLVLVSVDSLRADAAAEMESYRYLAAAGISFTQVDAPAAPDAPHVADLLTGLPLAAAGHAGILPAEAATLAERLRDRGYDTAAAVGPDAQAGLALGNFRGFTVYHHFSDRNAFALPRWRENLHPASVHERGFVGRPLAADLLTWLGVLPPPIFGAADDVVAVAGRIMAERRSGPIFLWIHLVDPQWPYAHAAEIDAARATRWRLSTLPPPPASEDVAAAESAYRNEVAHVDRALLQFFRALDKEAKRPTVIALTATRGEGLFGTTTSAGSIPLVMRGLAGVASGETSNLAVRLTDVAPTFLEAAGGAQAAGGGTGLVARLAAVP